MLNGVRKANGVTHSNSGTLAVIDTQQLLFMTVYICNGYLGNIKTV
jgi:hypothetical protein